MRTILLMVGLPASGKSTYAKELLKKECRWKRVSRDDIRLMLDNVAFDPQNEAVVSKVETAIVEECLRNKRDVIIDACHLSGRTRNQWQKFASNWGDVTVLSKNFEVSAKECVKRDAARPNPVGAEVIDGMAKRYGTKKGFPAELDAYFPNKNFVQIDQGEELPRAFICDLDGTLADNSWRNVYDASECDRDPVVEHVKMIVKAHIAVGDTPLFVTGRDEEFREKTEIFLKALGFPTDNLYMRPHRDKRKDTVVKKEIFNGQLVEQFNVMYCIDDRPSVCRMYRYDLGLPVLQVNDREF